METKLAFHCGGLSATPLEDGWRDKPLNLWPKAGRPNVYLEVTQLYDKFWQNLPPQYEDLLEIAAYIYSGDQAAVRAEDEDLDTMCAKWRRQFHYHIPVRVPEFWNRSEVQSTLKGVLEFLTGDYFDFSFHPAKNAPEVQTFLDIAGGGSRFTQPDKLVLFSGGLDSLAGVVRDAVGAKEKLLLLNHRSNDKFSPLYETLFRQLTAKVNPVPLSQVRVLINKQAKLGRDFAQRARSFLFFSMGMTVATILKLDELTCYENGVVSLNLPLCGQITGTKATRTTHPRVIRGLEELGKLLAGGKRFQIHTPFFWHTKGDVVREILKENCGDLIATSRSCAGTILRSKVKPHCGVCSQCIDRRIGVIAAAAAEHDPASGYEIDFFGDALPKPVDKITTAEFINRAFEVEACASATELVGEQPEVALALPYLNGNQNGVAERILKLYKQHAVEVESALDWMQKNLAKQARRGKLPADCVHRIMNDPGSVTVLPVESAPNKRNGDIEAALPFVAPAGEEDRLRWDNDFNDVYVGGVHYNLASRDAARHCIRYLVAMGAFDKASARHLEREINVYVRKQVKRDVLKPGSDGNLRIQHYFSGSDKSYLRLHKELVKPAGRNGCFYLQVR